MTTTSPANAIRIVNSSARRTTVLRFHSTQTTTATPSAARMVTSTSYVTLPRPNAPPISRAHAGQEAMHRTGSVSRSGIRRAKDTQFVVNMDEWAYSNPDPRPTGGVLKEEVEDFEVREIDRYGRVADFDGRSRVRAPAVIRSGASDYTLVHDESAEDASSLWRPRTGAQQSSLSRGRSEEGLADEHPSAPVDEVKNPADVCPRPRNDDLIAAYYEGTRNAEEVLRAADLDFLHKNLAEDLLEFAGDSKYVAEKVLTLRRENNQTTDQMIDRMLRVRGALVRKFDIWSLRAPGKLVSQDECKIYVARDRSLSEALLLVTEDARTEVLHFVEAGFQSGTLRIGNLNEMSIKKLRPALCGGSGGAVPDLALSMWSG